jgi:hypothetical protein
MKDIMEGISPLPLSLDEFQSTDGKIQIIDAAGGLIADFLDEDDAARVIYACNIYPELVEALFDMMWIYQGKPYPAENARVDEILAILAKCKAGAE